MSVDNRPIRDSWRDYPPEYITALVTAHREGEVRLGPMAWNDVRFSQREWYRLTATLRRTASEDTDAAGYLAMADTLRVSCPRCEAPHDLRLHWFVLKANPIVAAVGPPQDAPERPAAPRPPIELPAPPRRSAGLPAGFPPAHRGRP